MKTLVGAYAASPCHSEWNPAWEAQYFQELAALPEIDGLELPFFGSLHRFDDDWFLSHIPARWDHVLTCIPGVMIAAGSDPSFGLASESASGREAALRFTEAARQAVIKLNRHLGRRAVLAVELHSAPPLGKSGVSSSVRAFTQSLREIRGWDWDGASLVVEHCDRFLVERSPAKGFLSIEDEIIAIRESTAPGNTPAAILINWGRSAIEGRSAGTPLAHARIAAQAGLLEAVIFSGATVGDSLYGDWADSHAPFGADGDGHSAHPRSLMGVSEAAQCMRELSSSTRFSGFKIQALPKTLSISDRVTFVAACLSSYERAMRLAGIR